MSNRPRCSDLKNDGTPCQGFALPGTDPPLCMVHAVPEEERKARARRGGKARATSKTLEKRAISESGIERMLDVKTVLRVLTEAVRGTDSNGQPLWVTREAAVAVLVSMLPREYRVTPAAARNAIETLWPDLAGKVSPESCFDSARKQWDALPDAHPIRNLSQEGRYPVALVAPWENRRKLEAAMPTPKVGRVYIDPDNVLRYDKDAPEPEIPEPEPQLEDLAFDVDLW